MNSAVRSIMQQTFPANIDNKLQSALKSPWNLKRNFFSFFASSSFKRQTKECVGKIHVIIMLQFDECSWSVGKCFILFILWRREKWERLSTGGEDKWRVWVSGWWVEKLEMKEGMLEKVWMGNVREKRHEKIELFTSFDELCSVKSGKLLGNFFSVTLNWTKTVSFQFDPQITFNSVNYNLFNS